MNNVGFFPYYREEKTKAYFMNKQVSNFTKKHRLKKIQKAQLAVAEQINQSKVGSIVKVLIDYFDETKGVFVGRDQNNSPQVDYNIQIVDNNNIMSGNFYDVKIIGYANGNFEGEVV